MTSQTFEEIVFNTYDCKDGDVCKEFLPPEVEVEDDVVDGLDIVTIYHTIGSTAIAETNLTTGGTHTQMEDDEGMIALTFRAKGNIRTLVEEKDGVKTTVKFDPTGKRIMVNPED